MRAFPIDEDQNHPESTGVSPRARNNIDGIRMSNAINYLNMARHRLNLTVRGNVTARRITASRASARWASRRKAAAKSFTVAGQVRLSCAAER